ncbi:MAG TPA: bifunctional acetate--CoA ligase family protein/GNAT family N-acetyltransferase [Gammaproteobacteria bacterium]
MSIRNLDALFRPRTIAVVGGSSKEGTVGGVLARNLIKGEFEAVHGGSLWIVNKSHRRVLGRKSYRHLDDLPAAPDLVIIATPASTVPQLVEEAGRCGARAAVVISAGFGEIGEAGRALQAQVLEAARRWKLRVVGPNCLGLLVPGLGINGSFAHIGARKGGLAFLSQSGAILTSMLDWANTRGVGFSSMLSLGNMIDVDGGDLLDYYAIDPNTRAVLIYAEGIRDARKFMSAARGCARAKPVIVVKSGRHPAGAQAASSHTAALAGSDDVYAAAFRRAGMLRVKKLEELFDAAEVLASFRPPAGRRVAILSNGGGLGVMAADALLDEGAKLAELSDETVDALNEVLPAAWSKANPIDIIGDAPPERYAVALDVIGKDRGVDVILVMHCPTAITSSEAAADAVIEKARSAGKPIIAAWLGGRDAASARNRFTEVGIPAYATPEQAIRAFMYLFRYRRNQELLMETPPSLPEAGERDLPRARKIIDDALARGQEWLDEVDAKAVLAAYRVPVVASERAKTPREAAEQAMKFNRPVALKLLSPDILHKSEAGAVLLNVDPANAEHAAERMIERVRRKFPGARIEAISVQEMADREDAWEVFAGMTVDAIFGPVMMFGEGGEVIEVVADRAMELPPLNAHLAMQLIKRTRINRRLRGFRSRPAVDREALAQVLTHIGQLVTDIPEIQELDANPILVSPRGVMALDARIRIAPTDLPGSERLCIRPYPKELETVFELHDGRKLLLRPIRPEDEPALQRMFDRMTPEEKRNRFLGPVKVLSHAQAARYSQLDYDRDMAFALVDPAEGEREIHAIVRLSADADNASGEYAILVLRHLAGHGVGTRLMQHLIDYAKRRGIDTLYGEVLAENRSMLAICRKLGFRVKREPEDPAVVHVALSLDDSE